MKVPPPHHHHHSTGLNIFLRQGKDLVEKGRLTDHAGEREQDPQGQLPRRRGWEDLGRGRVASQDAAGCRKVSVWL